MTTPSPDVSAFPASPSITVDVDSFFITCCGEQPGVEYNGYYQDEGYHSLVASFTVGGHYDSSKEGHRLGNGGLFVFSRYENGDLELLQTFQTKSAGELVPNTNIVRYAKIPNATIVEGLDSPVAVVLSPHGDLLHVATYRDHGIVTFTRNLETGKLKWKSMLPDQVEGKESGLMFVAAMCSSPDGERLFVSSLSDTVSMFRWDKMLGKLRFEDSFWDRSTENPKAQYNTSIVCSHDGKRVYVAGQNSATIAVFEPDPVYGKLRYLESARCENQPGQPLAGVSRLTISPDDRFLYACSSGQRVVCFEIKRLR